MDGTRIESKSVIGPTLIAQKSPAILLPASLDRVFEAISRENAKFERYFTAGATSSVHFGTIWHCVRQNFAARSQDTFLRDLEAQPHLDVRRRAFFGGWLRGSNGKADVEPAVKAQRPIGIV